MTDTATDRSRFRVVAVTALGVTIAAGLLTTAATPTLLWVIQPNHGTVVGAEGVEVIVRFPDEARVVPESLRVLLNGADVTSRLIIGGNGASGQLFELLDGENVLRFEVSGERGGLLGTIVEQSREVHFMVRLPQNLNRG